MTVKLPTFYKVAADAAPNTLNYGNFISAIINFIILALVVFCIMKAFNAASDKMKKKQEAEAAAAPAVPPEPSSEEKLLTEIRDLLAQKK